MSTVAAILVFAEHALICLPLTLRFWRTASTVAATVVAALAVVAIIPAGAISPRLLPMMTCRWSRRGMLASMDRFVSLHLVAAIVVISGRHRSAFRVVAGALIAVGQGFFVADRARVHVLVPPGRFSAVEGLVAGPLLIAATAISLFAVPAFFPFDLTAIPLSHRCFS